MFEQNKDLSPLTTFHLPARARLFAEYKSAKELLQISRSDEYLENEILHIGGGSNLLFDGDFNGLVLHSAIKGITDYRKDSDTVYVIAGAGEKWSDLVDHCVDRGIAGLECMAGIPGEVGASPVQNVGAYGSEAGDSIHNVEVFDTLTREVVTIKGSECGFAYRDSRFKHEWKGRYFVLRVSFRLRQGDKVTNLKYKALQEFADKLGRIPTLGEVRDEVIRMRGTKLPDPALIGSAGSFFKNPVVSEHFYDQEVLSRDSSTPCYRLGDGRVKVPAGWLIEHSGMKGKRVGNAEVYPQNCLVLANTGNATAGDMLQLATEVRRAVNRRFAIELHQEVNTISTDIRVTILGSGTSKGVPEAGCDCEVCTSDDPHDKRTRSSVMVQTMGHTFVIDASPDFRQQMLREHVREIDALLVTHTHYDHVGGFDDLRPYCTFGNLPVYLREDVNIDLHRRLDYCFREHPYPGVPKYEMNVIDNKPFMIDGIRIVPIEVMHGKMPIFGYRIGDFAYVTDCKTISEEEKEKLYGLDTLVLNALRERPHFAHLNFEEALALIDEVKPRHAYLTHLCHHAGKHEEINRRLPDNVRVAYDGQTFTIK